MITLRNPRRARQDNIVPMVNVAFLLLVFFLMSAVIAPPAPVKIEVPSTSEAFGNGDGATLYVAPGGEMIGADGLLLQNLSELAGEPVTVFADATFPANSFVQIVENLQAAGVTEIHLTARKKLE